MSGSAAVDTNAYIALRSGDLGVASLIGSLDHVYLPVVVLGELLYGAGASGRAAENRKQVEAFVAQSIALEITPAVAEQYGELRLQLRASGRPIPDNDLWIAAACVVADLPLITRDAHYSHLTAVHILAW
jgi:tRNA(fMet)-specific endonuclease VapC